MGNQTFKSDKNRRQKQKTTPVSESIKNQNIAKIPRFKEILNIWLGMRDSNPRSRDQNPLPYRLANPHC